MADSVEALFGAYLKAFKSFCPALRLQPRELHVRPAAKALPRIPRAGYAGEAVHALPGGHARPHRAHHQQVLSLSLLRELFGGL